GPGGRRPRAALLPFLYVSSGAWQRLELESALTSAFRERGHAPVIQVAAAVEHHPRDFGRARALGQQLAERTAQLRLGHVLLLPQLLQLRRERGRADENAAPHVVDHLALHVLQRPVDHQPRPLGRAGNPPAHAPGPTQPALPPLACVMTQCHPIPRRATSRPPCRPCAGRARPGTGSPCPCTAPEAGPHGSPPPPAPPAACRSPRPRSSSGSAS